jgi:hypothetical protein
MNIRTEAALQLHHKRSRLPVEHAPDLKQIKFLRRACSVRFLCCSNIAHCKPAALTMVQQQLLLVKLNRSCGYDTKHVSCERKAITTHNRGSVPRDTIVTQCYSGCLILSKIPHTNSGIRWKSSSVCDPMIFLSTEPKALRSESHSQLEYDSKPSCLCLLDSLTNPNQFDWSTDWSPIVC